MLAAVLSFYGLSNGTDGADTAAQGQGEQTEQLDVTDEEEVQGVDDLTIGGGSAADKKKWVALHKDIMRVSLVDRTSQRTSLFRTVLGKMPKSLLWIVLVVMLVLALVVFIPLTMALVAVWQADSTVKVKITMHLVFTLLILAAAFVMPISVA